MNVLIAVASKHGGTFGIGGAIADELRQAGIGAEVRDVADVSGLEGYDAVVLGSAVYVGHWLAAARRFVDANLAALRSVPVWVFSSGPLGDPPKPTDDLRDVELLAARVKARGHRVFAGRLDPADLGLRERLLAKAVRAPAGDFREWAAIREWARGIASTLRPPTASDA